MPSPSATTEKSPPTPEPTESPDTPSLGLSLPQVAGSALAAVTAAVAASWLGVAGTIAGAAVGSVLGTVGSALYAHSLRQGSQAVRRFRPSRDGHSVRIGDPTWRDRLRELPWRKIAVASAVVLVLALGAITAFEKLTGTSVSRGSDGTTVGQVLDRGSSSTEPTNQAPADRSNGNDSEPGVDHAEPTTPAPSPAAPTPTGQAPEPDPTAPPSDTVTPDPAPSQEPSPTVDPPPAPEAPVP